MEGEQVSKEQVDKATQAALSQKLSEVGKNMHRCELCLATSWSLGEYVRIPVQDPLSASTVIGGTALIMAAMICQNCGNTKFINMLRLGVVSDIKGKPGEQELDPQKIADDVDKHFREDQESQEGAQ